MSLHDGSGLSLSLILALCFASRGCHRQRCTSELRRIQPRHPADPVGPLLPVPRPGRGEAEGQAAARPRGIGPAACWAARPRSPGDLDASELYRRITLDRRRRSGCRRRERQGRCSPEQVRNARRLDRAGRDLAGALVVRPTAGGRRAPAVKQPDWVRNPIDAFVLARLEREGLAPSPEAGRGRPDPPRSRST